MKTWLRKLVLRWLGVDSYEDRLRDLERHFVTKRDQQGSVTETLADVPVNQREKLRGMRAAGMTSQQRKAYLEATDGGRRGPVAERMASTS